MYSSHLAFKKDWTLFQEQLQSYRNRWAHDCNAPQVILDMIPRKGKEIRGQLIFLTAQLLGKFTPAHGALACAIECLHTASLLHDDVLDEGQMRRGFFCAHRVLGNTVAILSGDWWLAQSFATLLEVHNWDAISCVQKAMVHLVQGQIADCQMTSHGMSAHSHVTRATYLAMIQDKTACLFSASALAAAIISGATEEQARALECYGMAMGMAYQLRDDAAEYGGSIKNWDSGHDFFQEKITFPWIVLSEQASLDEWRSIVSIQKAARTKILQGDFSENLAASMESSLGSIHTAFQGGVCATYALADAYQMRAIKALLSCWQPSSIHDLVHWGKGFGL